MAKKWIEDPATGCWNWAQFTDPDGYGRTYCAGRNSQLAHRWSYQHFVGEIPTGMDVDHLCRNRACVNPAHLEAVTHAENVRRSEPATKTHCVNGHEFTPENTYLRTNNDGRRQCRACNRAAVSRYKQRTAA